MYSKQQRDIVQDYIIKWNLLDFINDNEIAYKIKGIVG